MRKRNLFIAIICLLAIAFSTIGCTTLIGWDETPEGMLKDLYSGKLGNVSERIAFPNLDEYVNYDHRSWGFSNYNEYQKATIKEFLDIDHSEGLKIEKFNIGFDTGKNSSYYRVSGTIYKKDGTSYSLDTLVNVYKTKSGKCVLSGQPFITYLQEARYYITSSGERICEEVITAYYNGNSIDFSIRYKNLTDKQYIISNWPKGPSITWNGQTISLDSPIIISSQNTPLYTLPNGEQCHGSIYVRFPLDHYISHSEAFKSILANNLIVKYFQDCYNNMPVGSKVTSEVEF